MYGEDMERVSCDHLSASIENVACGAESLYWRDADGVIADQGKGERRVEQGDVDATLVGTVGHPPLQ